MFSHEQIAEVCHETNRAYCRVIGDNSQVAWADAPEWQRTSAIEGVAGALAGNTPEQQHESWLAGKARDGWVWGPVKDADAKEHPCFVAYANLPPEQRIKDALYIGVVRALSADAESVV